MSLKDSLQWLKELFQKLFALFDGREDNYEKDNELLAGMAENEEEKAAIEQICDEIDETNNALDEVSEAARNGEDPTEWLAEALKEMAKEQGEPISDEDVKNALEKDAENQAEMVSEFMNDDTNEKEEEK